MDPRPFTSTPSPRAPRDPRDAAGADGEPLGALPVWDYSGLYAEPADDAIAADIKQIEADASAFADAYQGKLASLSGAAFAEAIAKYESVNERVGRVLSYLGLRYRQKADEPARAKAYGDADAAITRGTAPMVFFLLELNRIDDARLEEMLAESAEAARYRPWLERSRAFRPHQLSDELERYLHDKSVVGSSSWVRLYDDTTAALKFDVVLDGETKTQSLEETLTLMSDAKPEKRAAGYAALTKVFQDNIQLFTLITNTLAKEKEIDDQWRKYPQPESFRHLANHVEAEVVDALRDSVVAAYPQLSHRYYRLKAKWLGVEKLEIWDRNAPLPDEDDRQIPWDEARDVVLGAYGDFAPEMADIAQQFFDKNWIDAPAGNGKAPGAFAHPTVAAAHPFVLLNYLGKTRDVFTLAHELGHGVHQVLAAGQGELLSHTPLTLAETASVFGEMLTFKRYLAAETDAKKRKAMLAGKVEDMINTVVRQIAFYSFESRVHRERREGELTAEKIGEIWMQAQKDSLGDAFNYPDSYASFWTYIPHFIHTPFYVYAYAFGDGLVNALYGVYEESVAKGEAGFQQKYFDLLRAGGTKGHKELLAPFGLDATDPTFWSKGLNLIAQMIDELEAMEG
ncbi:MAG: M3 family oligoendopeptidase [Neomegalonema sp.]|nr:M3 family oligoendopeptidase [Neomegalonema sp.]